MKSNKEVLSSVLKTTQMGQIGIRSVLELDMNQSLRKSMESQLREYDQIESEAHSIATSRQWRLPELSSSIRFMTDQMTKMRLSFGNKESKIAAMMIRGNTSGIIKGYRNLNQLNGPYEDVVNLSHKLLDTEESNVQQMQKYL